MQVTYLSHSGFLLEWEHAYFLFDYYEGELPEFSKEKDLMVFVSHKHGDHYNRNIWELRKSHPGVTYIVSKDVPLSAGQREKLNLSDTDMARVCRVKADETYCFDAVGGKKLEVITLRSTDEGVAFLISYQEKIIFHAGDLNLWTWPEESKQYNEDMTKAFRQQMEKIRGKKIDVAFLPLDGRQGEEAGRGFDIFMETADIKTAFPMHFWDDYNIITNYLRTRKNKPFCSRIRTINNKGQVFLFALSLK